MFNNFYQSNVKTQKKIFCKTHSKLEDSLIFLKNFFICDRYHNVLRILNYFCFIIYSSSFLLETNFLIRNFSFALLLKYGFSYSIAGYVSNLAKAL